MKYRWMVIVVILAMSTLLCGCWDTIDVENLDISLIAGYDTPPSGEAGKVAVTALLAAVVEEDEKIGTYSAQTVGETRSRRAYNEPRQYTLSQLQVMLIGKDLARQGFRNIIDPNMREPRVKPSINVAVVNGRAEELLHFMAKKDIKRVSDVLISLLQIIPERAFVPRTSLFCLAADSYAPGMAVAVPVLQPADNQQGVELTGCALFAQDRMIAQLDRMETRSLVLLSGKKAHGWIPFSLYKDGQLYDEGTVFVANQRKVKVSRQGELIVFDIQVTLKGRLVEHAVVQHSSTLYEEQHLREIEEAVADDLKMQMQDFIEFMQEELRIDAIDITPYALAKWRQEIAPQLEQGFIEDVLINLTCLCNSQSHPAVD
jgi:Ger(x)C family germination protein